MELTTEIIDIFKRKLDFKQKEEIEKFIYDNINMEKYTFYHIHIFLKLFLSKFELFKEKVTFLMNGVDETSKYIEIFYKCSKYFIKGCFSEIILNQNYIQKDYINLHSKIEANDLDNKSFDIPLIFMNKRKRLFFRIIIDKNEDRYKTKNDYLFEIKRIMQLENEVNRSKKDKQSLLYILNSNSDNYAIVNDNYKKMILLLYLIQANVPFIIMGETGIGKTSLIIKLNQLLNNGKITLEKINISPNMTEQIIYNEIKRINDENKNKIEEIWIFFDDINTCNYLNIITEIFTNRTFFGEKLNENIRIMGACNPYRKNRIVDDYFHNNDDEKNLIYPVYPLPQSLLCYVFNFGMINKEEEEKYIYYMIESLFTKDEEKLHKLTKTAIFECHIFLRNLFDYSVASLRDVNIFIKIADFFQKYYLIKEEFINNQNKEDKKLLYKIKSIICSIYLCYYFRLNLEERQNFESRIRSILLELVNQLKDDLKRELKNKFYYFSDLLKIEEDFLLNKIELKSSIHQNSILKEITFLSFVSIIAKTPLFIFGKPGLGKTLGISLIINSMKGKNSKSEFFKKYPPIITTYFKGADYDNPYMKTFLQISEDQIKKYNDKNGINKEELPINLIILDNMELLSKNKNIITKYINSQFDNFNKTKNLSFISISNSLLDYQKTNGCLILSLFNLEKNMDFLNETCKSIVSSISRDLYGYKFFKIIIRAYYEYKEIINILPELTAFKSYIKELGEQIDFKKISFREILKNKNYQNLLTQKKTEFHGIRDFFNLIKEIEIELTNLKVFDNKQIVSAIIEKCTERNFGGAYYKTDIDLNILNDEFYVNSRYIAKDIKYILNEINIDNNQNNKKEKITSVFLFKKIYNLTIDKDYLDYIDYKINKNNLLKYNLSKCITDNINDINSRFLLIEVNYSLSLLLYKIIQIQNPDKKIDFYELSPFKDDNNDNYNYIIK